MTAAVTRMGQDLDAEWLQRQNGGAYAEIRQMVWDGASIAEIDAMAVGRFGKYGNGAFWIMTCHNTALSIMRKTKPLKGER